MIFNYLLSNERVIEFFCYTAFLFIGCSLLSLWVVYWWWFHGFMKVLRRIHFSSCAILINLNMAYLWALLDVKYLYLVII
jgi:hypothetical protein